jgi:hypothetical protein
VFFRTVCELSECHHAILSARLIVEELTPALTDRRVGFAEHLLRERFMA